MVIAFSTAGVILIVFGNYKIHDNPYIIVLNCRDEKAEKAALSILERSVKSYTVKSKTINHTGVELTAELRTKDESTHFVNDISVLDGIENATLVSYNGEYMS